MNKQNAIHAAVAGVLLLGGAFVIWISVIRPQLDASSRGQLAVAQRQLIELRAELAQAQESDDGEGLEGDGLRGLTDAELTTDRGRLIDEVQKLSDLTSSLTEERNRLENELDELTTNQEEARTETQTLQIEGRVLKSEIDTLTLEAESLQRNVRAISRDILIKADQREKLQTANELLTERLAN